MKVHYFQRYHEKENVATANTMLLLSRIYSYRPEYLYTLVSSFLFGDSFDPAPGIRMQEKTKSSVPDAVIFQPAFQVVVETKVTDWFHSDQLMNHLEAFGDEPHKVLLTVSSEEMERRKMEEFEKALASYNASQAHPVLHVNTTFSALAKAVRDIITDSDFELQEILDDYEDCCIRDGLISDAWQKLELVQASQSYDMSLRHGVYYDQKRYSRCSYIGLYKQKSIRAIGKLSALVWVEETAAADGAAPALTYQTVYGELTPASQARLDAVIQERHSRGESGSLWYYIVDQFYGTDFRKVTPYGTWRNRRFDLTDYLPGITEDTMPDTAEIADRLRTATWL